VLAASACCRADKPIWLAISRPGLVEAIKPLAAHRRAEGFETVVSTEPVAKAISSSPRRPAFVLLVGDDRPGGEAEPWCVPTRRRELYRWRASQRRQFASDAAWGDFDGDLAPDVPVGRIPARTAKQVEAVVAKTLAYERRSPTSADLGLVAWAGSPGYGKVVDGMVTGLGLSTFRSNAPPWAAPWAILGSAAHPLCGWPPEQPERFARRLRQGGLLAVLIGHAGATSFFSMRHGSEGVLLRASDVQSAWAKGEPGPPAMLITCNCGRFDADVPCLAESLLMMPAGPVATVGATTESHPLTNYFTSVALLKQLGGHQRRVGEVWLTAQRKARKARSFVWERILRDVEGKLEKEINVAKLRRDQILMYAIFGDPAARMKLPEPLQITVERKEDGWHWRADRPEGATRLHVARRPAKWTLPPARPDRPREQARADFDKALASAAFRPIVELTSAAGWAGVVKQPGVLRLVATGSGRLWAAAAKLTPPTTQPKPAADASEPPRVDSRTPHAPRHRRQFEPERRHISAHGGSRGCADALQTRAPSGAIHGRARHCATPEGAGLLTGRCPCPTAAAVGWDVAPSGLTDRAHHEHEKA